MAARPFLIPLWPLQEGLRRKNSLHPPHQGLEVGSALGRGLVVPLQELDDILRPGLEARDGAAQVPGELVKVPVSIFLAKALGDCQVVQVDGQKPRRGVVCLHYQDVPVMELPMEDAQDMKGAEKPAQEKDHALSKALEGSRRKQLLLFLHVFEQVARFGYPPGDQETLQERAHPADFSNGHRLDRLDSP